jgi:cytochrome P450/glutathione S-transferase
VVLFKLISIRISPFCELARWVLERQGIPYREECHAPILSLPFTWVADRSLNVPVILAADTTLEVKDFLDYIDARARASDKILPLDGGERQEAEQIIVSLLTGLAITVRQYAYANMLPNRKVTSSLMVVRVPWWEWSFVKGLYPLQMWLMRKALKITPESTEQARLTILAQFDDFSKRLGPGKDFLVGDRLTAVDLVFAAGTAPVTVPPEYGAPFPKISDMPAAMQATVRSVQATPAGQHALRIYREYRTLAATAPDTSPLGEPGIFKRGWDAFKRGLTGPAALRLASHLLRMKPVLSIGKTTVISTYEVVVKALDDDEKYTIAEINAARMDRISGPFILGMDRGAQYDRENAAIRSVVKPTDLDWVRRIVKETANGLISTATPAGRLDVSSEYVRISAARVVAEYFGVPGPSEHVLMQWMRSLFWDVFLNRTDVPAVRADADQSAAELRAYLTALIAERAAMGAPGDDILSRLIRAETLDADGIRRNITGIVVGAIDTTTTAATNALAVLLDKPEAMAETRKAARTGDEAAIRQYVYEALRFNPQTSALLRYQKADGNTALLMTISAMFDPKAFPRPGSFNATRPPQKYLHFSHGMHTCYGLMINGVQLPALVGAIVQLPNLRRASGRFGPVLYEGPFPDRLVVEFGGQT